MSSFSRLLALAVLVPAALASAPAHATVDGFIMYSVPFLHPQTEDVCFMRLPLMTSFGIPSAAVTGASLTPTAVLKDFPTKQYININLAAQSKLMVHTYVSDAVTNTGVWEYTMKLNVSALATSNGTSLAGRTATVKAAKLALLAIARNMDDLSNGLYRLRVTFIGLPSQTGLPGTALNASTSFPYTASSALLAAYADQLINVDGSCQPEWEY